MVIFVNAVTRGGAERLSELVAALLGAEVMRWPRGHTVDPVLLADFCRSWRDETPAVVALCGARSALVAEAAGAGGYVITEEGEPAAAEHPRCFCFAAGELEQSTEGALARLCAFLGQPCGEERLRAALGAFRPAPEAVRRGVESRPAPAQRPLRLKRPLRLCVLTGPYLSYQQASRALRSALVAAGAALVAEPRLADAVLIHDELGRVPAYFARFPSLRDKYVVGYVVWETDRLPPNRIAALALLDALWTPSCFTLALLSRHHRDVTRVPHVVERRPAGNEALDAMRARVQHDERLFYFYAITRGDDPRKNLPALLGAFERLRAERDDVRLIVKQYGEPSAVEHIEGVIGIGEQLSDDGIAALHTLGDVLVSPHRAEGWGLPLSDAMAHGNPVIATDYSGSRDFLSELEGYPVPYRLVAIDADVAEAFPKWSEQMRWAAVDEEALLDAMRRAHAQRGRDERGWRASAIVERYGPAAAVRTLRRALVAIEQAPPSAGGRQQLRTSRTRSAEAVGRPSVGMFHRLEEDDALILGRRQAARELMGAYCRHGSAIDYAIFAPQSEVEPLQQQLGPPAPYAAVHARRHLTRMLRAAPVSVWHDLQLDTAAPFEVRAQLQRNLPVTIVHHTISYRHLLHERWLPLLLAQPEPYDAIICSSTAARAALRKLLDTCAERFNVAHGSALSYAGRYEVIPLGVDTQRFRPRDPRLGRNRFGLDPDALVLLWVGRLSAVDKADLLPLLQVLSQLKQRHERLQLVCCGTERDIEKTSAILRDYGARLGINDALVVLTDVQDALEELYACADVFVSPADSLQESFGLAVLEAMACGVPQVVSDWNGYRDTVVEGETGYRIPTYWAQIDDDLVERHAPWQLDHLSMAQSLAVDVGALTRALDRLLSDEALRRRMSHNSRERAERHYDWRHIVHAHEQLWLELSAQAEQAPPLAVRHSDYTQPSYVQAFDHYPTRMLGDDTLLAMTAHGRRVAAQQLEAPLHYDRQWRYLEAAMLRVLIPLFAAAGEAGATIGAACAAVLREGPSAAEVALARRHVMWLLKYDIIGLAAARA